MILDLRKKLDSTVGRRYGKTETACRLGSCEERSDSRGKTCSSAHNVFDGIDNDVIKEHNDRKLDDHRTATAHGVEVFSLVEILNLLCNLLLSSLVVSALIAISDRHFLRTKSCLLDGILLLLDCEGHHKNFNEDSKQADTDEVVAKADGICDKTEERSPGQFLD